MGGVGAPTGDAAIAALPYVDEHAYEVAAGPEETWAALPTVVERSFGGGVTPRAARALGCEDVAAAGLALAGSHRFSRYALTSRVDALGPSRSRVRAETRAERGGAA